MNFALTPRQARTGLDVLTALVVISVGIALAGLTWRIGGHAGVGAITVPSGQSGPAIAPDIAATIALAPFGKPVVTDASQPTTLPLLLKGVFAARPAEASTAFIAVEGKPAMVFRIGETVSGAMIQSILRDRVILTNGGRTEYLAFPDPALTPEQRAAAAAAAAQQPASASALLPGSGSPPAAAPQPSAMMLQRLDATQVAGGLKIGANGPAGMVSGDVVESVNGTALTDAAATGSAFAAAQASGSAQVQILRDGKRLTLTVPLR